MTHELLNNLGLRKLGNIQKTLKFGWVEGEPSAQYPFQKLSFDNGSQKTRKSEYQALLVPSKFTGFLFLVPIILSSIVVFSNFLLVLTKFLPSRKTEY